jgi:ubiquinone/menaquinone biosynthesis C-methylase UbiE
MADESMLRTLAAQVRCIWPQEQQLCERYGQPRRILDVGCGTGELTFRLAEHYPEAQIVGVELEPSHVARAAVHCAPFGDRVRVEVGDAYALDVDPDTFDLVVCRHVLQSIPQPELVVDQCRRALAPGGWLHLLLEDYTMIHVDGPSTLDRFWLDGPVRFAEATGVDARIGRRGSALLSAFEDVRLDYITVDTDRVSRDDFAAVFTAWRDGYSAPLAPYLGCTTEDVRATWDAMIEAIRTRYALWQVPVASGQKPGAPPS